MSWIGGERGVGGAGVSWTSTYLDITDVQLVRNSGKETTQSRAGGKVISALHRLMSHKKPLTGSLNDSQRSQPLVSDT